MFFLIVIFAAFFAINMGGSGFAASFAAAYGGRAIGRIKASFLFIIFVVLGAVTLGQDVSVTLGNKIIPAELLDTNALLIIFFSASISMFISNLMRIPQSTSLVTVGAIAGVGIFYKQINYETIVYLTPFWIFLPILAFGLTYFLGKQIYPPRKQNFWIYERLINQKERLKKFVILAACYNAFSVGTNNVANVVGPLIGNGSFEILPSLLLMGLVFGAGGIVFTGPIKTAGDRVVPLGLMTASIVALVCGSLMLIASYLGVPQSFVMLKMAALFAVSALKNGKEFTFQDPTTRKTFYTWIFNPVITLFLAYLLSWMFLSKV